MKMKKNTVYDNYNLLETYPDEELKQMALDCGWVNSEEEITENKLWQWRYEEDQDDWFKARFELESFFADCPFVVKGSCGRWNGTSHGWKIYTEFQEFFSDMFKDCDYWSFTTEGGHLYYYGTHHDGSVSGEIKMLSKKGTVRFDRWLNNEISTSERKFDEVLWSKYSVLPHYAKKVFGCKEYGKEA